MPAPPITAVVHREQANAALADWRTRSACRGRADLMNTTDGATRTRAVHLCLSCPVIADCRAWLTGVDDATDPGGVAGGWTERERRRGREIARCRARNAGRVKAS